MVHPAASGPVYRPWRYRLARAFCALAVRLVLRPRIEGRGRLPARPALLCFNHLNWVDPLVLLALLPVQPKVAMFGPKEEDMRVGGRNRLIAWVGSGIPYKPAKNDLIEITRRVGRALDDGWVIAIAGEGRIHRGERELLPLAQGPAYFALRSRVPIVPIAINGTSWLGFGRRVRVRVGEPLEPAGRPDRATVEALTARLDASLRDLIADYPDPPEPGRFGRWLTEVFNDWPEGARPDLGPDGTGVAPTQRGGTAA